jgi:hypothetical protein
MLTSGTRSEGLEIAAASLSSDRAALRAFTQLNQEDTAATELQI